MTVIVIKELKITTVHNTTIVTITGTNNVVPIPYNPVGWNWLTIMTYIIEVSIQFMKVYQ